VTPEQAAYSKVQAVSIPNAPMTAGWRPSSTAKETGENQIGLKQREAR
jgi:hypothetical protein